MAADFADFARGLPYTEITTVKVLTSEYENGVVQKRKKWHKDKKSWEIRFKTNTLTEIQAIRDYFIATDGSADTFTFTEPLSDVAYTVRFKDDSFTLERQHHGVYNSSVIIEEDL